MNRILIALSALTLIAASGCGSEAGTGATPAAQDATSNNDGAGNVDVADAGTSDATSAADTSGQVCTPGEAKCGTGAAVTRLVCKADGSGWDEVICDGLNATCSNGTCIAPDAGQENDAGTSDAGQPVDAGTDPCGGLCTASQTCVNGVCVDGEPCGGKCAEGSECKGDVCVPIPCGGKCPNGQFCDKAADGGKGKCIAPTCKLPDTWGPGLQKISKFVLKPEGKGCDLDGDGKEDNAVGLQLILDGVNNWLSDELVSGERVTFMQPSAWKNDGTPFDIVMLTGFIDPLDKACDKKKATCKYKVHTFNYDIFFKGTAACPPKAFWTNAKNTAGALAAGDDKTKLTVGYTFDGEYFEATVHQAHIKGTVTDDKAWTSTKSGTLCGVMTQKELDKLIDAVPDSQIPAGLSKDQIKSLLPSFLKTDIDTDGDGTKDAYSAAFDFETIPATVTGLDK